MSWIGVGVLKTGAEKTEKLLIEETPILTMMSCFFEVREGKKFKGGREK